jgi:hypothetical protein
LPSGNIEECPETSGESAQNSTHKGRCCTAHCLMRRSIEDVMDLFPALQATLHSLRKKARRHITRL